MAQWGALQRLDAAQQQQVNQMYETMHFPMEVRHYLSHWMEKTDWGVAAANEIRARSCFHELLQQLDALRQAFVLENNILQRPNFTRIRNDLQTCFQEDPLYMASIICSCLTTERDILQSAAAQENGVNSANPRLEAGQQMDHMIAHLRQLLQEVESVLDKQEEVDSRIKSFNDQDDSFPGEGAAVLLRVAVQQIVNLLQLAEQTVETLTGEELPLWRRRQQRACIGGPDNTSLDQLETWFTAVAELLLRLRGRVQIIPGEESTRQLLQKMQFLLEKLLEKALVVERQPCMSSLTHRPLVVKTKTQFSVKLRFLANLPDLRDHLRVEAVLQEDSVKGFRKFTFENGVQTKWLGLESPGGGLVAEFGQTSDSLLSLKEKTRRPTEGPVSVTEELHVITFVTQLNKDGLKVHIQSSSLPVVVVSSSNQVPAAWASVLWYNMMDPEQDLSLFVRPPPVPWQVLSDVLSWQFKSISGRGLDDRQLNAIRDKLTDDPDDIITWGRFCNKNEGVWFWLNGILELIKTYLLDLWDAGYIMGFVSKDAAAALLMEKPNGTFLLRFSDSARDGAVTFSWVERIGLNRATVRAVKPYTRKELTGVSMSDEVYNYKFQQGSEAPSNPLLYLYPDIPKDQAFSRFKAEAPPPPVIDGYVSRTPCPRTHMSFNPTPPPSPPQQQPNTPPVPEDMIWTPTTDCSEDLLLQHL